MPIPDLDVPAALRSTVWTIRWTSRIEPIQGYATIANNVDSSREGILVDLIRLLSLYKLVVRVALFDV